MIRGVKHLSSEERLRKLELLRTEKRKLWGGLVAAFQCLKRFYRRAGVGLFTRACSDRKRGKGFKLEECRIRL